MRVLEILLKPGQYRDTDLSSDRLEKIDFLKQRMASYVDKICDSKISAAGREFLKSKLRDDLEELKTLVPRLDTVAESINRVPLSDKDFEAFKELFDRPIPAAVARIYTEGVIDDDSLSDEFAILEDSDPSRDVRPLIAEWFSRVMPDQMFRLTDDVPSERQKLGLMSPIHGYDNRQFNQSRFGNSSGNAYGRF